MQLYNTLSRRIEPIDPIGANEVTIYSCGPTVYKTVHLGNFRTYILNDVLRRAFEYDGFAVRHVMNITDVGHLVGDGDEGADKVEESARNEHKTAWEVASFYEHLFWEDAEKLHILRPTTVCKATSHIPEQIALIERLEEKGFTYTTSDGIYFSVEQFPQYGALTGQLLTEKQAGARVDVNDQKKNPADFALWKFSYPDGRQFDAAIDDAETRRQMEWASPWGLGYPGWHIECSAMSTKYLGQPFDIHTGGIDLISPHHTNEIAQSEAAYEAPLANTWVHGEFMMVDDQKMSKSIGNVYSVQDLIDRGHNPLSFRFLTLMTHYRKPLNFTWEGLAAAEQALNKLILLVRNLPTPEDDTIAPEEFMGMFRDAINDDLSMPQAVALFWDMLKSTIPDQEKSVAVAAWDQVLGLGLAVHLGDLPEVPDDILQLAFERDTYRKSGDYERADSIRQELLSKGYEIQDSQDGPTVIPHTNATPL